MILSRHHILARLKNDELFKPGTWCASSLTEASYVLRVASDGLMLDGKHYPPNEGSSVKTIQIEPGKIAVLSTVERLRMPGDLVGKIGIRFDYATQGLTGLMGIQVDPFFGWEHDDERLYIRVANLGNEKIIIFPEDGVFTFELHQLAGLVPAPSSSRTLMWNRLRRVLGRQENASWSNVTRVQADTEKEISQIRDYLQPLVMFGIFLIAATILSVMLSVVVAGRDIPEVYVPKWVRDWGWKFLLAIFFTGAFATAAVAIATVITAIATVRRPRR